MSSSQPYYIMLPPDYGKVSDKKYPLLIMLGGASGSKKGYLNSAKYWVNHCNISHIVRNLQRQRVHGKQYFYNKQYKKAKETIKKYPLTDMIIVMPYTKNGIRDYYTDYLVKELVPHIEKKFNTISMQEFRAIDGACLGGAQALYTAFTYPNVFGSVGGIQADIRDFGKQINASLSRNFDLIKNNIKLNINTSTGDTYYWLLKNYSEKLNKNYLKHTFNIYKGKHDYSFYRNVGGIDSLLFHNTNFQKEFNHIKKSVLKEEPVI